VTGLALDLGTFVRGVVALAGVLALLVAVLWLVRRHGGIGLHGTPAAARLAIMAALPLDARVRLVLVRRDGVEHLLAVGPGGATVVESVPARGEAGCPSAPVP
jgi:flagellar protein FliO/FliZ